MRQQLKVGRITTLPDGMIDPVAADAAWPDTSAKRRPGWKPANNDMTFTQARTAHERLRVKRAALELAVRKGQLVDRGKMLALVMGLAMSEREHWIAWPSRIAAIVAAEFHVEQQVAFAVLSKLVREHLGELAALALEEPPPVVD